MARTEVFTEHLLPARHNSYMSHDPTAFMFSLVVRDRNREDSHFPEEARCHSCLVPGHMANEHPRTVMN